MKKIILIIVLLALATQAFAFPPSPPVNQGAMAITGGTINGTTVGATTPAAGTFTTVTANTSVSTDTIAEKTGGAGVTIDGVLIKDSAIPVANITGAAASADLATDNSTASHALYKDASGNVANQVLSIDAHAGSTTITLIPGVCPVIHNTSQADANVTNALPAVASGLCFTALVTTTEDDKTWRLSAAAVNTICLGATCGKDDIGFATGQNTKGGMFKCVAQGTEWFCHTVTGTVDAGDL
jgi:hypothetical protein